METIELQEVVEQEDVVELSAEFLGMVGGGSCPGMSY